MKQEPKFRQGFTLVELLVVIAIIGILIAMLFTALQAVRGAARRAACQNNLKQLGMGILNYESTRMKFPPGQKWTAVVGSPNRGDYSWIAEILPQIEGVNIQSQIDFKRPFVDPVNWMAISQIVPSLLCPSTADRDGARGPDDLMLNFDQINGLNLACTDYMGVAGASPQRRNPRTTEFYKHQNGILIGVKGLDHEDTMLVPPSIDMASITDGTSETIMITECTGRGTERDGDPHGAWFSGKNVTHVEGAVNAKRAKDSWNDELIYSEHSGGANAVCADGSVHFLSASTAGEVIYSRCSRNGEEIIPQE